MAFLFKTLETYLETIDSKVANSFSGDGDSDAQTDSSQARVSAAPAFGVMEGRAAGATESGTVGVNDDRLPIATGREPATSAAWAPPMDSSVIRTVLDESAWAVDAIFPDVDLASRADAGRTEDPEHVPPAEAAGTPRVTGGAADPSSPSSSSPPPRDVRLALDGADPSAPNASPPTETEFALLQSKIQRLESDRHHVTVALQAKEGEISSLRAECAQLQMSSKSVAEQLKDATRLHAEKEVRFTNQIEHLLSQIDMIRKENVSPSDFEELLQRLNKEKADKEAQKRDMDSRVAAWERQRLELETQLAQLQVTSEAAAKEAASLRSLNQQERETALKASQELAEYRTRAQKLMAKKVAEIDRLQELLDNKESATAASDESRNSPGTAQDEAERLKAQVASLLASAAQREEALSALEAELVQLQKSSVSTQDRLRSDLEFEKQTCALLQSELSSFRRDADHRKQELALAHEQMVELHASLQEKAREQEVEIQRLTAELKHVEGPAEQRAGEAATGAKLAGYHETSAEVTLMIAELREELLDRQRQLELLSSERSQLVFSLDEANRRNYELQTKLEFFSRQQTPAAVRRGWLTSDGSLSIGAGAGGATGPVRIKASSASRSVASSLDDSVDLEDHARTPGSTSQFFEDLSRRGHLGQRVVSAAYHVDNISLDIATVLARYPLARVVLVVYLLLLHLFVWVALFSRTHAVPHGGQSVVSGADHSTMQPGAGVGH